MQTILYLDADFLRRAWAIGGKEYLDKLAMLAKRDGYILSMTDVVAYELSRAEFGYGIEKWLNVNQIRPVSTQEFKPYMEYQKAKVPGGNKYRSATLGLDGGDASILERMRAERRAGIRVMVASDDKFFRAPLDKKGKKIGHTIRGFGFDPNSTTLSTPHFINQLKVLGILTFKERANITGLDIFNRHKMDNYSPELSRVLLSDAEATRIQKEGGAATVTLMSKFGKGLKFLGIAGLIYDIGTSSAEAAEAARNGNAARAGEVMAKLAARTYGGLKLGMLAGGAAAVLLAGTPFVLAGVLLGGIAGGIAGAVAGDMLAERIWGAARKAIGMLSQTHPDNKVGYFAVVEQDLAARKVPGDIARKVAVGLNDGSLADAHVKTALRKHMHRLDKAIAANAKAPVVGEIVVRHIDLGYSGDRSKTTVVDGDQGMTFNQDGKLLEERSYGQQGLVRVKTIDEWVGDASTRYSELVYGANGKVTKETNVTPYGRVEHDYDPSSGIRVREMHFDQHDVLIRSRTLRARDEAEDRRYEAELTARRKREQRLQAERLAEQRRQADENKRRERIKAEQLAAVARREEAQRDAARAQVRFVVQQSHSNMRPMYGPFGVSGVWSLPGFSYGGSVPSPSAPAPSSIPVVTLPPVIIKGEIDPRGNLDHHFSNPDVRRQIEAGWAKVQPQLHHQYQLGGWRSGMPVVLDLDRSGTFDIRPPSTDDAYSGTDAMTREAGAPRFDFDGDGISDRTAWVGPDDGFLVIDRGAELGSEADGSIDQSQEVAFTQWKSPQAWQAELDAQPAGTRVDRITDLSALRLLFDSNGDGVLDRHDEQWHGFRVWQDQDQDGVAAPGELRTLEQAGITAIGLVPDASQTVRYADGSAITGTSYARLKDGSRMRVGDLALRFESSAVARRQGRNAMFGARECCQMSGKLDNLVAAMAGFAPPAGGRLTLPPPHIPRSAPVVIAAN